MIGWLVAVVPVALLVGGAISWVASQWWRRREERKAAGEDAAKTLTGRLSLLEKMVASEPDENKREAPCRAE